MALAAVALCQTAQLSWSLPLLSFGGIISFQIVAVIAFLLPVGINAFVAFLFGDFARWGLKQPIILSSALFCVSATTILCFYQVVFPAYFRVSFITQVILRIGVQPVLFEVLQTVLRNGSTLGLQVHIPLMHRQAFYMTLCLAVDVIGRIMNTNAATFLDVAILAIGKGAVERAIRSTRAVRDQHVQGCWMNMCAKCFRHQQSAGENEAQRAALSAGENRTALVKRPSGEVRLAEALDVVTVVLSDDFSIFTAVAFSLLFRIPPQVGAPPSSTEQIILKGVLQYGLATLMQLISPALLHMQVLTCVDASRLRGIVGKLARTNPGLSGQPAPVQLGTPSSNSTASLSSQPEKQTSLRTSDSTQLLRKGCCCRGIRLTATDECVQSRCSEQQDVFRALHASVSATPCLHSLPKLRLQAAVVQALGGGGSQFGRGSRSPPPHH